MNVLRKPVTTVIIVFWFFFWLLNGLDKFFARQNVGLVHWWGNHRVEKFSMYFEKLALSPAYVQATLIFAGIVECAAAGFFVIAAIRLLGNNAGTAFRSDLAIPVSIAVFLCFTIFDVIVGDRAELLEHSTYICVLLVSFLAMAAESLLQDTQKYSRRPSKVGRDKSEISAST